MESDLQFPGDFQIWWYGVSLRQLLIRRTKTDQHRRLDIYFKAVDEVHLKTSFTGIRIRPRQDGRHEISCGDEDGFFVEGLLVGFHEDDGSYYDKSHFSTEINIAPGVFPSAPEPGRTES